MFLGWIDFFKNYKVKDDAVKENEIKKLTTFLFILEVLKIATNEETLKIDNRSMCGTHYSCFYLKNFESFYLGSFDGRFDEVLLKQIPKRITFHIFEWQDINGILCGAHCFYFFNQKKEGITEMVFDKSNSIK